MDHRDTRRPADRPAPDRTLTKVDEVEPSSLVPPAANGIEQARHDGKCSVLLTKPVRTGEPSGVQIRATDLRKGVEARHTGRSKWWTGNPRLRN